MWTVNLPILISILPLLQKAREKIEAEPAVKAQEDDEEKSHADWPH